MHMNEVDQTRWTQRRLLSDLCKPGLRFHNLRLRPVATEGIGPQIFLCPQKFTLNI